MCSVSSRQNLCSMKREAEEAHREKRFRSALMNIFRDAVALGGS